MKKILLFGSGGQVGYEIKKLAPEIHATSNNPESNNYLSLDEFDQVKNLIRKIRPDVIINAAAYTNVDGCENNKSLAFNVNGESLRHITSEARKLNSYLIHISTDYVFDGNVGRYREDSIPNPINFYGLSKLVGDTYALSYENTLVVRTSGVYGRKSNFPVFAYNQLISGNPLNVIEDFYSPIHAGNLARAIIELSENRRTGIINVASERASRYEFARKIASRFDLNQSLIHKVSEIKGSIARRPKDSSLNIELAKGVLNFDFYSIESNLELLSESIRGE